MGNEGLRQKITYIASQQTNGLVIDGQIGNKEIERKKNMEECKWKENENQRHKKELGQIQN